MQLRINTTIELVDEAGTVDELMLTREVAHVDSDRIRENIQRLANAAKAHFDDEVTD